MFHNVGFGSFCGTVCMIFSLFMYNSTAVHTTDACVLEYTNTAYFTNVTIEAIKKDRFTNMLFVNGTILQPWGNNVTLEFSLRNLKNTKDQLQLKLGMCYVLKWKWVAMYFRRFSTFPLECPMKANTYRIFNASFPPSNLPFHLQENDYNMTFVAYRTRGGERIYKFACVVRYIKVYKNNKQY